MQFTCIRNMKFYYSLEYESRGSMRPNDGNTITYSFNTNVRNQ